METHADSNTSRAWLWNGAAFEPATGLPPTDRGFRYGMSVFESFPVRHGIGAFLDQHLSRLRDACAATGFSIPRTSLDACASLLRGCSDGFARIYVTGGDGAVTEDFRNCRVLILIEPRAPVPSRVYHRGYDLAMHPGAHVHLFPGLKTGNYWANLRSFREGVAAQRNETLLFTTAGHLISACMANVFLVTGGQVKTADLSTGARAGVVREWVMGRVETEECLLTRAEVEAADEIFLTSSWLGIMPAAAIEGRPLRERTVASRLLEAWRK